MSKQLPLADRLKALAEAAELSRDRSTSEVVAKAEQVVNRAGQRFALSGDRTVVALAGATGSGKSTSFNAISGTEFATTGVKRPTTSQAMAVAWGTELPHELLDWLDVPRRHLIPTGDRKLANLVLLDLPDHDSTEESHRMTVDRLVELVDMLVWIVDPQKYADAALHDRYLKPLAPYADVMVVVLNQADRLWGDELERCLADLRRLLDSEGLAKTKVMSMSALTGVGVSELRELLAQAVAGKTAAARRVGTDVGVAGGALLAELGSGEPQAIERRQRDALVESLAEAAGVPIVTASVRDAWIHRGGLATGWPFVKWVARFKPDPLRALRLDQTQRQLSPTSVSRTSLPAANSVQRARVDRGLRELFDTAAAGLPRGWAEAVRNAARGREALLLDRLDGAIAKADLGLHRGNGWWSIVRVLQWVFMVAVVAGAAWLAAGPVALYLGVGALPTVTWWGWPASTVLLVGGVAGGLLLAALSWVGVRLGASLKANQAERILHEAIGVVTQEEILAPVEQERDRYRRAVAAARRAAS